MFRALAGVRLAARRADAAGGQHHFGVDAADRSSVKCAAPGRASPLGTISGSVHANAGSPARDRRPSIRARSSSRWTARTGVTPGMSGSSVKRAGDGATPARRTPESEPRTGPALRTPVDVDGGRGGDVAGPPPVAVAVHVPRRIRGCLREGGERG